MADLLDDFEEECRRDGLDVNTVVRASGLATSTYWRWRTERFEPRQSSVRKLRETRERLKAEQSTSVEA